MRFDNSYTPLFSLEHVPSRDFPRAKVLAIAELEVTGLVRWSGYTVERRDQA